MSIFETVAHIMLPKHVGRLKQMAWIKNLKNFERLKDSTEYMKAVYGDPLAYLKETEPPEKFLTDREYLGDLGYGECFNSTSSSTQPVAIYVRWIQCELISGDFDPKTLPYEKRLAWHFREFCYKTSAHVWIILFLGCMTMLYQNAQSVLDKYHRNEKIVDIQLKFGYFAMKICYLFFRIESNLLFSRQSRTTFSTIQR
ncbi:unnamed protein product [Toxocara canis]|uniref:Anoctamin n=1 Tax=Toxocara canis TaxID=6265 RepID=A0A183USY4_TOXCA|nr:unnamed protein product [Toxocara canis]